ncbi:hypothetical protein AB1Y20_015035 [Prymnesium parvum]|uniref:Methyltransferase FkbM domain-containing protein n=1 Tax=Prymnesium parvum TaxID=97485 RepID=A0AB34JWN4_PRYPA
MKRIYGALLCLAFAITVSKCQSACEREGVVCGSVDHAAVDTATLAPSQSKRRWSAPDKCLSDTNFAHLEDLWPKMHFRGPISGPKSYFHRVPPHYLGRHANFTRCRRRVYIDVGAGQFNSQGSSEGFLSMMKLYPSLVEFDEFYVFEAVPGKYVLPPPRERKRVLKNAGMRASRAATFNRRHFFMQAFVGARSDTSTVPPTIGFSDFLLTMLQLQPADAVVVKMDVEGYEYEVVDTLLRDGTAELIDEIMLEVHYSHPDMLRAFRWCKTPQFWCKYSLDNATSLYTSLRGSGVYAHTWP